MPKITSEPLVGVYIRLYKKDYAQVKKLYGEEFGVNRALRAILRSFLTQTEAKTRLAIDALAPPQTEPSAPAKGKKP